MAKQTGLGDQFFVAGVDIGADINSIGSLATPRNTLPGTDITQSGTARLLGTRDGQAEFVSYFNDAAGASFPLLKTLPTADTHVMYLRGTTRGNSSLAMVGKQVNYDPQRGDDGSFLFTTSVMNNGFGADWCVQATAGKQTDAAAANSPSVDLGVQGTAGSRSFGFQAYLQVFSIGSGTATVKLQESSDDGAGDAFADITGGAFTAVTGSTTERIQSASDTLTVERYIRVVTTGVFTNLVFAVGFNRNEGTRAI